MIVFTSFIRAVYDRDLLPAWTAHYLSFKFDRYVVYLDSGDKGIIGTIIFNIA